MSALQEARVAPTTRPMRGHQRYDEKMGSGTTVSSCGSAKSYWVGTIY